MTTTLPTVLISGASEELTARIEQLIRGQAELSLVESVTPDVAESRDFKAKLVWVELESDPEGNVALLEKLIKAHPNTFFVVSKEDLDPELVKRAMQVGALDFLDHKGWAAQIRSVVRRIMAKEFGSKPTQAAGGLTSRQPARQSSWGALNSVKVQPNSGGFKRVEPNRPGAAQPAPTPKPAPAPIPAAPAAVAKPVPPPPPVVEPEVVEEAEEVSEQPSYEEPAYAEPEEQGYEESEADFETGSDSNLAEGEYQQAYENAGEGNDDPETTGEYAEAAAEREYAAEGEYPTEGEYPAEGDYQQEGEYPAESEYQTEAEYSNEEAPEDSNLASMDSSPYEPASHSEADEPVDEEIPVAPHDAEPELAAEEESETQPEPEPEAEAEPEPVPAKFEAPPAVKTKARWDDLDSLISKETPKAPAEKKPASKWGELGNIQPKIQKETTSSDKKWSDLDAIVAPKSSGASDAPAAASKWGDLDAIGGLKSEKTESVGSEESVPAPSKWGDLDSISAGKAKDEAEPPEALESSWGDLDSIASAPKAFGKTETGPSSSKWGDLNSIGAKPKDEPVEPASKWGNLDSLGGKGGGGGLKSNARSFIKPKTGDESPTKTNSGLGAFADLGLAPGQPNAGSAGGGTGSAGADEPYDPYGMNPVSTAGLGGTDASPAGGVGSVGGGGTAVGGGGGLGGSLGGSGAAGGLGKVPSGGDVDSNPSAFKNRFGRKTQNIDLNTTNPQDALTSGAGGGSNAPAAEGGPGKWGNLDAIGGAAGTAAGGGYGDLNSIPTPKSAQEQSGGNWGSLEAIPTPRGPGDPSGPKLVEGALPKSRARNEASEKWKSGMGAELSEGQREFGELADKIKEKTAVRVKVAAGWKQASVILAAALLASVGYLSIAFFTIPEPPAEMEATQ